MHSYKLQILRAGAYSSTPRLSHLRCQPVVMIGNASEASSREMSGTSQGRSGTSCVWPSPVAEVGNKNAHSSQSSLTAE